MARKFRLGVHRKNEFLKKRVLQFQDRDHPASTISVLQRKITELAVLPKGRLSMLVPV